MFDKLLQIIAPHHCYYCQKTGDVLCDSCIYNIANDEESICIECRKPTLSGVCADCKLPYFKTWVVATREGELAKLIDDYKWFRMYGAHISLSKLLDNRLPVLPEATVVVPIPTISHHKRIRGYDHADLIASHFAKSRNISKQNILKRKNNSIQHTADRSKRRLQAEEAFYCKDSLDPNVPYLIIDDIVTTGSTIKAATRVLKGAGVNEVWVAAIARQPLN